MEVGHAFPLELLSQPSDARWSYFSNNVFVAHHNLLETFKLVQQKIRYSNAGRLIFLMGTAGVGKTTLALMLRKMIIEEFLQEMERDPGLIPIVVVPAVLYNNKPFDWVDFYRRALIALNEPLVEYKISFDDEVNFGVRTVKRSRNGQLIFENPVARDFRMAFENCLAHRRPRIFIIDEAHHLLKIRNGQRVLDQMDVIKTLADHTGTKYLLIGTYELRHLANLSGQLGRRGRRPIHFSNYDVYNDPAAEKTFKEIVNSLQQQLPLAEPPKLVEMWEYLYERSLGCTGLLKDWLSDALGEALDENAQTLTEAHLKNNELTSGELVKNLKEMEEGKQWLEEIESMNDALREKLKASNKQEKGKKTASEQNGTSPKGKKQTHRPGERNPKRDKVGRQRQNDQ